MQFKRNMKDEGLPNIANCCSFLSKPEKLTTSSRLATRKEGWVGRSQYEVRQLLMLMVKFYRKLWNPKAGVKLYILYFWNCHMLARSWAAVGFCDRPVCKRFSVSFLQLHNSFFCLGPAFVQTLAAACEANNSWESEIVSPIAAAALVLSVTFGFEPSPKGKWFARYRPFGQKYLSISDGVPTYLTRAE